MNNRFWWRDASLSDKMMVYEAYCQKHDRFSFEEFDQHYRYCGFYTVMHLYM